MASGNRKRHYQPSVTSYFSTLSERTYNSSNSSSSNNTSILSPSVSHPTIAPSVPSAVQSSLLNVGMRVRKAVPEGYKNKASIAHVGATKFTTGFESSAFDQENNYTYPTRPPTNTYNSNTRSGELLPFCGVHKVGGWGVQDESTFDHAVPALTFDETPFSSQESNMSSFSAGSMPPAPTRLAMHPKKRQLEDYEDHYGDEEDEEEADHEEAVVVDKDYPVFTIFADGAVDEHQLGGQEGMTLDRRIARPVTRKKTLPQRPAPTGAFDFEEASFLQLPAGGEEEMEEW